MDKYYIPQLILTECQILALTADNATNMDTLSEHLEEQVPSYSTVNRTRCFTHILNLVAKSLLRQFYVTLKKLSGYDSDEDNPEIKLTAEEEELLELAEGLDQEELTMAQQDEGNNDEDGADEDDEEGWVDELDELSVEERDELKLHIRPVSRVLVKV
jgi:hypothetical protein